ncbi:ATP-binding protein [Roseateles puraquae]|uniref:AAA family ATPase n=1 Tax=Roseateles puraquae TaxID=431059 RepID=UPI0031E186FE
MLLSYSFSNFNSFIDQAEVSFVLTQRDTAEGWVRTTQSGRRVTTAMAVMGANGAGKSTLIRVGGFLAWFMSESFGLAPDAPLPFRPHMARLTDPSEFKVVYEGDDGTEWVYELKVRSNKVVYEALSNRAPNPGARFTRVFTREARDETYSVYQTFGLADSEATKVRPNVSLISWAKQYGSELAMRIATISLATNVGEWGRLETPTGGQFDAAAFFEKNPTHRDFMRRLMTRWDFGLTDIKIESLPAIPSGRESRDINWFPVGVHQVQGQRFELPMWLESSGTQRAFILLWMLLPVLEKGGLALVDEFEADLHPHMIEPLVRLFHSDESNPHGAQIVFTCHSPEVLRSFHRAQVTFVEKDECMSQAYRGDAIEGLTNQHNLYNKYLAGALGAVPEV